LDFLKERPDGKNRIDGWEGNLHGPLCQLRCGTHLRKPGLLDSVLN